MRFIWLLNNFFDNIILYDIDLKHFFSIANLRLIFSKEEDKEKKIKGINILDENTRVLFYSKKAKNDSEYYRYGVNILAGKNAEEFQYLNNRIWNHHYSFKLNLAKLTDESIVECSDSSHLKSVLFTKGKNLHYYEVLLSTSTINEDKISLFEKSVQYSLNTSLKEKQTALTNNKGYKIENTHFRLGSKIHISDFYYAKKLFQNSFFTTPLAYKIAQNIYQDYLSKSDDSINNSFTLVGYESYSSFLISTIRNFLIRLNDNKSNIKINHSTIDKDGNISIDVKRIYNKILIVVPISTSFNTCLKIEDQINDIFKSINRTKEVEVIPNSQNVVLVAHRDKDKVVFEYYIDKEGKVIQNENNIFKKYAWTHIDKAEKVITLERYNVPASDTEKETNKERTQKYLVPVYTTWHEAADCTLCYPTDVPVKELCLIETGKASITPQVIFDYPKSKKTTSQLKNYVPSLSFEGSLLFGSLKRRKNKYLFYTRTGKLVEKNEEIIIEWIKKLKSKIFDKILNQQKVVIVTPTTGSKSKFLDLVNEYLFEYTANCIIISLQEDYIENAETLYSDGLHSANIVVYVDDVLSTINSFLEVNFIVKYIRRKTETKNGIDYCISLVNRMSYENEENLLLKLLDLNKPDDQPQNRLLYLQKINNPTVEEANNKFPLELENERYKALELNSSLDQIRYYFETKKNNIKANNLKKSIKEDVKDYSLDFSRNRKKRNKKLFQFLVLNAIYELFEIDKSSGLHKKKDKLDRYFPREILSNDKQVIKDSLKLLNTDLKIILQEDLQHELIIEDNLKNLNYVIIKLICSTPLIYYEQIRLSAFSWIHLMLESLIQEIKKINNPINFFKINKNSDYNYYQDLKFLLKKSVKVKSNYIIHYKTFSFLKEVIEKVSEINNDSKKSIDDINLEFCGELQRIVENQEYLINPIIKLKCYDLIQNNLKDGIIDLIVFDSFKIKKDGIYDETTKLDSLKENAYHNQLIESANRYRLEKITEDKTDLTKIGNRVAIIKSEDKKIWDSFKIDYDKLLSHTRYKLSTNKNLIVHLVALVQELVYEHEVKSFKLDEVIKAFREVNRIKRDCNINGSFAHFLRLLHLENIEIINKYSLELINQHKDLLDLKKINEFNNQHLEVGYVKKAYVKKILVNDRKYKELCSLAPNENSLCSFISLKKYLTDSYKSKGKEDKINIKTNIVINKIKSIIDGDDENSLVNDVFFTINYKDFEEYKTSDLYTFSLNEGVAEKLKLINDNKSLTSLMGNEQFVTSDKHLFSHFEIIKNDAGDLVCRDDQEIKSKIDSSQQFISLENNRYILLIRISEFKKNSKLDGKKFITRGVVTIYLNQNKRLEEKKLRLLLALRQDLLQFINKKTQGSTFLELLNYETEKNLIKNNSHYLNHFKKNLESILEYLTQYDVKKEQYIERVEKLRTQVSNISEFPEKDILNKEAELIIDAIFAQINMIDDKRVMDNYIISLEDFKTHINLILKSQYIGSKGFNYYKIYDDNFPKEFKLFELQKNVIIPQLLINIKQYSINSPNNIVIDYSKGFLIFENYIGSTGDKKRIRGGKQICENLTKKIFKKELENNPKLEEFILFEKKDNKYTVKLKIKN